MTDEEFKSLSVLQQTYRQIVMAHRPGAVFTEMRMDPARYDVLCKEMVAEQRAKGEPVFYKHGCGLAAFLNDEAPFPPGLMVGGVAIRPRDLVEPIKLEKISA